MMLTACDASHDGRLLDVTAMTPAQLDELHGWRARATSPHDPVCRHCQRPVHEVRHRSGLVFWRHDRGEGVGCLTAEVAREGQTTEHVAAKTALVRTLRNLTGWQAQPEHRFEADGDVVIVDVYAHHNRPAAHQQPTLWEVQLSAEPHGRLVERTEQRRRLAEARAAWVTPHSDRLGDLLGMVTDPTATLVFDRLYSSPSGDDEDRLPPIRLTEVVTSIARRRPRLLWSQTGEPLPRTDARTWMLFPPGAAGSSPWEDSSRRAPHGRLAYVDDVNDCDRQPVALTSGAPRRRRPVSEPYGPCRWCGDPSWMADDEGEPAHACCTDNERRRPGKPCPACAASRSLNETWRRRQRRYPAVPVADEARRWP